MLPRVSFHSLSRTFSGWIWGDGEQLQEWRHLGTENTKLCIFQDKYLLLSVALALGLIFIVIFGTMFVSSVRTASRNLVATDCLIWYEVWNITFRHILIIFLAAPVLIRLPGIFFHRDKQPDSTLTAFP